MTVRKLWGWGDVVVEYLEKGKREEGHYLQSCRTMTNIIPLELTRETPLDSIQKLKRQYGLSDHLLFLFRGVDDGKFSTALQNDFFEDGEDLTGVRVEESCIRRVFDTTNALVRSHGHINDASRIYPGFVLSFDTTSGDSTARFWLEFKSEMEYWYFVKAVKRLSSGRDVTTTGNCYIGTGIWTESASTSSTWCNWSCSDQNVSFSDSYNNIMYSVLVNDIVGSLALALDYILPDQVSTF